MNDSDDVELRRGKAAARLLGDPDLKGFFDRLEQVYTDAAMLSEPGEAGRATRETAQAKFAALRELRAELGNAAAYGSMIDNKRNR